MQLVFSVKFILFDTKINKLNYIFEIFLNILVVDKLFDLNIFTRIKRDHISVGWKIRKTS